jgi:hypothetical protein
MAGIFDENIFDSLIFDCTDPVAALVRLTNRHMLALSADTTPLARRSALALANSTAKRARRSR